jgi:hypothetical protein
MASKIETSYSGMFLDTKLRTILDDLNKDLINSRLSTKEEVSAIFNKIIKDYKQTLNKSLFTYKPVITGTDPDVIKFNSDNIIIYNDLKIIYQSLKKTRDLLASNYNTLSGMILKVKSDIAESSSNLIDFKIQNTDKFNPSYTDSFFNLFKIESDETKYTKGKAFVDIFNNNLVLPLDKEAEAAKIKKVSIGEDSIGASGNNQEIGGLSRENLKLAFDNSIDTWFEFEQVGASELQSPTVLNIKIEFEQELFFNLLDINTVQMPNGSYPVIMEIKGSVDGANFFDLKSLYLGAKDWDSIGNEIIPLGENPENPNNGNLLYFTPRKLKFLNIKLMEDSSFFIRTSSGIKYRRAIGVKELKAKSQKFKNEGQLITTNFLSNKEISKIALFTDEYLPPNFKTTFNYFISVDNGQNWDPISPTQKIKENIPEILNYNIDFLESSKKTDFPVASVKLKADFLIEEGEESTSVTSSYITKNQTEFVSIAPGSKSISLERVPFGDVHLYRTNYGSVGKDSYYKISLTGLKELNDRFILQLPIEVYKSLSIQVDQEELYIDNYLWSRVDSLNESYLVTDYVYEFDYLNNIVTFNKQILDNRHGKKPAGDIFFKLKRENVALKKIESGTEIITNHRHDAIKENISIYSIDEKQSSLDYKLKNMASVHRVGVQEIDEVIIISDSSNILSLERNFNNGVMELLIPGDYSIDKKHGIIYTFSSLSSTDEVKVKVKYRTKTPVSFEIKDGSLITTQQLKKDNKVFDINITLETYAINLGFKNIEEKTIVFTNFPSSMQTEVPFSEIDTLFNETGTSGRYAIDYKNGILFLQNKINGKLAGTLINSNYFAEYNISYKIPSTEYTLVRAERRIDFSDKNISDFFNLSSNQVLTPNLVKVEYVYTEDVKESLSELFPYTTPFLKEYKIITTPKELL